MPLLPWPRPSPTLSVSPSTPTTRTCASVGDRIALGDRAPAARPGRPPALSRRERPSGARRGLPDHAPRPSAPVDGGAASARTPAAITNRKSPAVARDRRPDHPPGHAEAHLGRVEQHQRAERHRDDAADRQDAVAHDLDLGDQEHDAEEDQEQPRVVDRQALEGEERQDQRDAADDAGQDHAGVRQLEEEPEHAEHHEHVGHVGVGDHVQEAVAEADLDRPDRQRPSWRASPGPSAVLIVRPSIFSSRSGTESATRSITFSFSGLALGDRRRTARTAFSAQSALRPRSMRDACG